MAIPLMAIGAGISLINSLFNKRPSFDLPAAPDFFGKNYEQALTAMRQHENARYGAGVNDLRELLANQGILANQGALTDAFTRQSIASGQNIASGVNDITQQERGAQLGFEGQRYGTEYDRNKTLYAGDMDARSRELDMLTKLGAAGGYLLANKGSQETPVAGTPGNQPYNPNDVLSGTGFGLEDENNPQNFGRKLLKTLFGF